MKKTSIKDVTFIGSGNVAKLANQVIVAVNIAAVSEALTLATAQASASCSISVLRA